MKNDQHGVDIEVTTVSSTPLFDELYHTLRLSNDLPELARNQSIKFSFYLCNSANGVPAVLTVDGNDSMKKEEQIQDDETTAHFLAISALYLMCRKPRQLAAMLYAEGCQMADDLLQNFAILRQRR